MTQSVLQTKAGSGLCDTVATRRGVQSSDTCISNKSGFSETQLQKKRSNIATPVNEKLRHVTMTGGGKTANLTVNTDI